MNLHALFSHKQVLSLSLLVALVAFLQASHSDARSLTYAYTHAAGPLSAKFPSLQHLAGPRSGDGPGEHTNSLDETVLRFNVTGDPNAAAEVLHAADASLLDIWEANSLWIDVRLGNNQMPELLAMLGQSLDNLTFEALLTGPELAAAIAATYPPTTTDSDLDGAYNGYSNGGDFSGADVFFDDYRPLSVLASWMELMESMFPGHVEMISVGKTYEDRDMYGLRVSGGESSDSLDGNDDTERKTILVSGGLHAREWIGVSTVAYIAYAFITGYQKYLDITDLVDTFDWVFIPTINPDGYSYSWEADRLWRKNRQTTPLPFCHGIDLDRTFDFHWEGPEQATASSNPCSENYAGAAPFEAAEAVALRNWVHNQTADAHMRLVGLLDLHSYSQQILYPYSYSCAAEPPTLEDLEELGQGLAKAIRFGGARYTVASACQGGAVPAARTADGQAGGSALDWFYHALGIRHAFQVKLRDTGAYGFLLPKEYIVPTGEEMLNAARHFGFSVKSYYSGDRTLSAQPPESDHPREFVSTGLQPAEGPQRLLGQSQPRQGS